MSFGEKSDLIPDVPVEQQNELSKPLQLSIRVEQIDG